MNPAAAAGPSSPAVGTPAHSNSPSPPSSHQQPRFPPLSPPREREQNPFIRQGGSPRDGDGHGGGRAFAYTADYAVGPRNPAVIAAMSPSHSSSSLIPSAAANPAGAPPMTTATARAKASPTSRSSPSSSLSRQPTWMRSIDFKDVDGFDLTLAALQPQPQQQQEHQQPWQQLQHQQAAPHPQIPPHLPPPGGAPNGVPPHVAADYPPSSQPFGFSSVVYTPPMPPKVVQGRAAQPQPEPEPEPQPAHVHPTQQQLPPGAHPAPSSPLPAQASDAVGASPSDRSTPRAATESPKERVGVPGSQAPSETFRPSAGAALWSSSSSQAGATDGIMSSADLYARQSGLGSFGDGDIEELVGPQDEYSSGGGGSGGRVGPGGRPTSVFSTMTADDGMGMGVGLGVGVAAVGMGAGAGSVRDSFGGRSVASVNALKRGSVLSFQTAMSGGAHSADDEYGGVGGVVVDEAPTASYSAAASPPNALGGMPPAARYSTSYDTTELPGLPGGLSTRGARFSALHADARATNAAPTSRASEGRQFAAPSEGSSSRTGTPASMTGARSSPDEVRQIPGGWLAGPSSSSSPAQSPAFSSAPLPDAVDQPRRAEEQRSSTTERRQPAAPDTPATHSRAASADAGASLGSGPRPPAKEDVTDAPTTTTWGGGAPDLLRSPAPDNYEARPPLSPLSDQTARMGAAHGGRDQAHEEKGEERSLPSQQQQQQSPSNHQRSSFPPATSAGGSRVGGEEEEANYAGTSGGGGRDTPAESNGASSATDVTAELEPATSELSSFALVPLPKSPLGGQGFPEPRAEADAHADADATAVGEGVPPPTGDAELSSAPPPMPPLPPAKDTIEAVPDSVTQQVALPSNDVLPPPLPVEARQEQPLPPPPPQEFDAVAAAAQLMSDPPEDGGGDGQAAALLSSPAVLAAERIQGPVSDFRARPLADISSAGARGSTSGRDGSVAPRGVGDATRTTAPAPLPASPIAEMMAAPGAGGGGNAVPRAALAEAPSQQAASAAMLLDRPSSPSVETPPREPSPPPEGEVEARAEWERANAKRIAQQGKERERARRAGASDPTAAAGGASAGAAVGSSRDGRREGGASSPSAGKRAQSFRQQLRPLQLVAATPDEADAVGGIADSPVAMTPGGAAGALLANPSDVRSGGDRRLRAVSAIAGTAGAAGLLPVPDQAAGGPAAATAAAPTTAATSSAVSTQQLQRQQARDQRRSVGAINLAMASTADTIASGVNGPYPVFPSPSTSATRITTAAGGGKMYPGNLPQRSLVPPFELQQRPDTLLSGLVGPDGVRRSPNDPEVCLECLMRDEDMIDVHVVGPGLWERESDRDWKEACRLELEEEVAQQSRKASGGGGANGAASVEGGASSSANHGTSVGGGGVGGGGGPNSDTQHSVTIPTPTSTSSSQRPRTLAKVKVKRLTKHDPLTAERLKLHTQLSPPASQHRWKTLQTFLAAQAKYIAMDQRMRAENAERARQAAAMAAASGQRPPGTQPLPPLPPIVGPGDYDNRVIRQNSKDSGAAAAAGGPSRAGSRASQSVLPTPPAKGDVGGEAARNNVGARTSGNSLFRDGFVLEDRLLDERERATKEKDIATAQQARRKLAASAPEPDGVSASPTVSLVAGATLGGMRSPVLSPAAALLQADEERKRFSSPLVDRIPHQHQHQHHSLPRGSVGPGVLPSRAGSAQDLRSIHGAILAGATSPTPPSPGALAPPMAPFASSSASGASSPVGRGSLGRTAGGASQLSLAASGSLLDMHVGMGPEDGRQHRISQQGFMPGTPIAMPSPSALSRAYYGFPGDGEPGGCGAAAQTADADPGAGAGAVLSHDDTFGTFETSERGGAADGERQQGGGGGSLPSSKGNRKKSGGLRGLFSRIAKGGGGGGGGASAAGAAKPETASLGQSNAETGSRRSQSPASSRLRTSSMAADATMDLQPPPGLAGLLSRARRSTSSLLGGSGRGESAASASAPPGTRGSLEASNSLSIYQNPPGMASQSSLDMGPFGSGPLPPPRRESKLPKEAAGGGGAGRTRPSSTMPPSSPVRAAPPPPPPQQQDAPRSRLRGATSSSQLASAARFWDGSRQQQRRSNAEVGPGGGSPPPRAQSPSASSSRKQRKRDEANGRSRERAYTLAEPPETLPRRSSMRIDAFQLIPGAGSPHASQAPPPVPSLPSLGSMGTIGSAPSTPSLAQLASVAAAAASSASPLNSSSPPQRQQEDGPHATPSSMQDPPLTNLESQQQRQPQQQQQARQEWQRQDVQSPPPVATMVTSPSNGTQVSTDASTKLSVPQLSGSALAPQGGGPADRRNSAPLVPAFAGEERRGSFDALSVASLGAPKRPPRSPHRSAHSRNDSHTEQNLTSDARSPSPSPRGFDAEASAPYMTAFPRSPDEPTHASAGYTGAAPSTPQQPQSGTVGGDGWQYQPGPYSQVISVSTPPREGPREGDDSVPSVRGVGELLESPRSTSEQVGQGGKSSNRKSRFMRLPFGRSKRESSAAAAAPPRAVSTIPVAGSRAAAAALGGSNDGAGHSASALDLSVPPAFRGAALDDSSLPSPGASPGGAAGFAEQRQRVLSTPADDRRDLPPRAQSAMGKLSSSRIISGLRSRSRAALIGEDSGED